MTHRSLNPYARGSLIVIASLVSLVASAAEVCVTKAWSAFNAEQYAEAIEYADTCITQFGAQAREQQASVESTPPCGAVSAEQKVLINKRGLLNDVATAAWIKSKSAEAMGDTPTARDAMRIVCELDHGRTWDQKGWFWAPCEGSCP